MAKDRFAARHRNKTEVETFGKTGSLTGATQFKTKTSTYGLVAKAGITALEADFVDNAITICFPSSEREAWATSDRIGFSNAADWNDPNALSLLVEKDFTCLDNTMEDQSDNYPNPLTALWPYHLPGLPY